MADRNNGDTTATATATATAGQADPAALLSRPMALALLNKRPAGQPVSGVAEAPERAAMSDALGVSAIETFSFDGRIFPDAEGGWRLEARLRARVIHACVVTLAPVPQDVDEAYERRWSPNAAVRGQMEWRAVGGRVFDVPAATEDAFFGDDAALPDVGDLSEEPAEPLTDPIDLGPSAVETLVLALDPYPKAPGAAFEGAQSGPPGAAPLTDDAARPFAALAALKARQDSGGDGSNGG